MGHRGLGVSVEQSRANAARVDHKTHRARASRHSEVVSDGTSSSDNSDSDCSPDDLDSDSLRPQRTPSHKLTFTRPMRGGEGLSADERRDGCAGQAEAEGFENGDDWEEDNDDEDQDEGEGEDLFDWRREADLLGYKDELEDLCEDEDNADAGAHAVGDHIDGFGEEGISEGEDGFDAGDTLAGYLSESASDLDAEYPCL